MELQATVKYRQRILQETEGSST